MALKWMATNNGGFWTDDSSGVNNWVEGPTPNTPQQQQYMPQSSVAPTQNTMTQKQLGDLEYQNSWGSYGGGNDLNNVQHASFTSGRPMAEIINTDPTFAHLRPQLTNWLAENPNLVHGSGAGQIQGDKSILQKTAGAIAPYAAAAASLYGGPVLGAAVGTGLSGIEGGFNEMKRDAVTNIASAYSADYLNKIGAFGGEMQGNRFGSAESKFANNIAKTQGIETYDGTTNPGVQSSNLETGASNPNLGNISKTNTNADFLSQRQTSIPSKQVVEEIKNKVVNGQTYNNNSTKLNDSKNPLNNIIKQISSGDWGGAAGTIAGTDFGREIIAGLVTNQLISGSKPDYEGPKSPNDLKMVDEMEKRLDPSFYAMTPEEKEYLYETNFEKLQRALGRQGKTRGGAELKAAADLVKQIELEDMTQRRALANSAFTNYVNWMGGRETNAMAEYQRELQIYQQKTSAWRQGVKELTDRVTGNYKSEQEKASDFYKQFASLFQSLYGNRG